MTGGGLAAMCHKTTMCRYYRLGTCSKGGSCGYAHTPEELKPAPDLKCTRLCKSLLLEGRCNDPNCRHAHTKQDLRHLPRQGGDGGDTSRPTADAAANSDTPSQVPAACSPAQISLGLQAVAADSLPEECLPTKERKGGAQASKVPAAARRAQIGLGLQAAAADSLPKECLKKKERKGGAQGFKVPAAASRAQIGLGLQAAAADSLDKECLEKKERKGDAQGFKVTRAARRAQILMDSQAATATPLAEECFPKEERKSSTQGSEADPVVAVAASDTSTSCPSPPCGAAAHPSSDAPAGPNDAAGDWEEGPTGATQEGRQRHGFRRTKMCKFHPRGMCMHGVNCSFAHHEQQLMPKPGHIFTKICTKLVRAGRCESRGCPYAHSAEELCALYERQYDAQQRGPPAAPCDALVAAAPHERCPMPTPTGDASPSSADSRGCSIYERNTFINICTTRRQACRSGHSVPPHI